MKFESETDKNGTPVHEEIGRLQFGIKRLFKEGGTKRAVMEELIEDDFEISPGLPGAQFCWFKDYAGMFQDSESEFRWLVETYLHRLVAEAQESVRAFFKAVAHMDKVWHPLGEDGPSDVEYLRSLENLKRD